MKKKCINWCHYSYGTRETLKKMRLLIILFFSGLLTVAASSYSQQTKFSLILENVTVQEIFEQIEENSEFVIFYNEAYLDLEQKFDVNVKNESVEFILDKIFEKNRNNYKIYDRQIVILPPEKTKSFVIEKNQQQERELTGKVVDGDGIPLPGASIVIKGTTVGAATNIDGNFTITIPTDKQVTLVVGFIGFDEQEIVVGDQTTINVTLTSDLQDIDEVVVIGYGQVKKKDLTGSVSTLGEDDFNLGGTVSSAEDMIQGRAAGVQVATVSAAPGSELIVRIRGNNSLLGGNSPLYVVDGMQMNSLGNEINVEDIKSMVILKDASATAVYGTRGANGVIIITTKRGVKGKTTIDYSYETTIDKVANLEAYDFLNATEYAEGRNYQASLSPSPVLPYDDEKLGIIEKYGEGTNWLEEIFQIGITQKHNVSVGASSENTSVFLSVHHMNQEGVVENTGFKKTSARFNFDQKLLNNKLKIKVSSLISSTSSEALAFNGGNGQSNILRNIFKGGNPIIPTSFEGWTEEDEEVLFNGKEVISPIAIVDLDEQLNSGLGITASGSAEFEIIEGLSFMGRIGIRSYNGKSRHFLPKVPGLVATDIPMGSARLGQSNSLSLLMESILRYNKNFGKHDINFTGVYSQNPEKGESFSAAAGDFVSDALKWNALQSGATPMSPYSGIWESNLVSLMGRVDYAYADRYNITASIRRDGSTRFGKSNPWANFPSVAAAWKVHNENFFNIDAISKLKFRASWGKTGNDRIGIGATQRSFSTGLNVTLDSNSLRKGIAASKLPNDDLKWETTTASNIGVELGLFDNRVSVEVDYYNKLTKDLFWHAPVSTTTGFGSQLSNIGTIENKGLEVTLSTINITTPKLLWTTDFTFSNNNNKIKELQLPPGIDHFGTAAVGHGVDVSALQVGQPIGSFYGWTYRGILQQGEVDPIQPGAVAGDPLWADISGPDGEPDGIISFEDKSFIGNGIPKYTYGINNNISYGNFQLSFFIYGIAGVDILNLTNITGYDFGLLRSSDTDRWRPDNPGGTQPQTAWGIHNTTYLTNTRTLESGDYISLKSLRLAYTVPTKDLGISWIRNLTVSFTGRNLLTFSNYSGFYPEVNSTNSGSYNAQTANVDSYAYPMARSYSFGVKVGF